MTIYQKKNGTNTEENTPWGSYMGEEVHTPKDVNVEKFDDPCGWLFHRQDRLFHSKF